MPSIQFPLCVTSFITIVALIKLRKLTLRQRTQRTYLCHCVIFVDCGISTVTEIQKRTIPSQKSCLRSTQLLKSVFCQVWEIFKQWFLKIFFQPHPLSLLVWLQSHEFCIFYYSPTCSWECSFWSFCVVFFFFLSLISIKWFLLFYFKLTNSFLCPFQSSVETMY